MARITAVEVTCRRRPPPQRPDAHLRQGIVDPPPLPPASCRALHPHRDHARPGQRGHAAGEYAHALRAYDAVQLAAALEIRQQAQDAGFAPVTLISADQALNDAATAEGLAVSAPAEKVPFLSTLFVHVLPRYLSHAYGRASYFVDNTRSRGSG